MNRGPCARAAPLPFAWWLAALLLATGLFASYPAAAAERHALLVGVSAYPTLPSARALRGPRNDVALLRDLLVGQGFTRERMRVLADDVPGAQGEPTRAAILGELRALSTSAVRGDFVFLYFAGHGSQQPSRAAAPDNPEDDGLDEIFLPRDVGRWDGGAGTVRNAIVDDEIGASIAAIRGRGAFVWAVFDTCFSGTITRAIEDDQVRYRDVDPALLGVPKLAGKRALPESVVRTRGIKALAAQGASFSAGDEGGFVAFYASQSWERAPEERLPAHLIAVDPRRRPYGLFTYTLAEVIAAHPGATYRQAAQQILQRYRAQARMQPTPSFEGAGLDAPLFGMRAAAQTQQWRIEQQGGALRIAAGALNRIGDGATFTVLANPADDDANAIGTLTAKRVELLESELFAVGSPRDVPPGAYARLRSANLAPVLRVARPQPAAGREHQRARALIDALAAAELPGLRVTWLAAGEAGDIRLALRDERLWLLPPGGELVTQGPMRSMSIALAGASDELLRDKLAENLRQIAWVGNLIALANNANAGPVADGLDLRLLHKRGAGAALEVRADRVPRFRENDTLTLRIANRLATPLDVTVLFIDSQYGVQAIFPDRPGDNRISPQGERQIAFAVNAQTVGREGLLVIATEARPQELTADFTFLQQPPLRWTRQPGGASPAIAQAIEAAWSGTRGPEPRAALTRVAMRVILWDNVGR